MKLNLYLPDAVDRALDEMRQQDIMSRIWAGDHTVWKPDPAEITNRLGWLRIAETMDKNRDQIEAFVESVRADGYTHALLLGMGGSSLAPEVFRKTFGVKDGYLDLAVLDSTERYCPARCGSMPDARPDQNAFIVATVGRHRRDAGTSFL
jgi:hypothetical protein